jgi:hypothetical protein
MRIDLKMKMKIKMYCANVDVNGNVYVDCLIQRPEVRMTSQTDVLRRSLSHYGADVVGLACWG